MQIRVLRENKNELELEIEGETYTLANLLNSYLLRQNGVNSAFKVEHYLIPNFKTVIMTERGSPYQALKNAIKDIATDLNALEQLVKSLED